MAGYLGRALGALVFVLLSSPASAQTWQSTLHERDANRDGVVDSYYDSTLDITWLRDWRAIDPRFHPAPGESDKEINWFRLAFEYAEGLSHLGVDDWRLPRAHNFSHPLQTRPGTELSHLYFVTLGAPRPDGTCGGWCQGGPLFNWMPWDNYWTTAVAGFADYPQPSTLILHGFDFGIGSAGEIPSYDTLGWLALITVVRDGDIALAVPVPEPSTYALMGVGLLGVVAMGRKRMQRGRQ